MRMRSIAVAVLACLAMTFLAGCGPKTPNAGGQTNGAPAATSAPTSPTTPSASPIPTVKEVTAGNCTVYPKVDAIKLLGGVNINNKALDIGTDGGTKIDVCSYIDLKGARDIQGVSYAVVRYDSAAKAFAEAKKAQKQMLGSAAQNNWPVQSLTTPAPGAGQVLGGYGSKTTAASRTRSLSSEPTSGHTWWPRSAPVPRVWPTRRSSR